MKPKQGIGPYFKKSSTKGSHLINRHGIHKKSVKQRKMVRKMMLQRDIHVKNMSPKHFSKYERGRTPLKGPVFTSSLTPNSAHQHSSVKEESSDEDDASDTANYSSFLVDDDSSAETSSSDGENWNMANSEEVCTDATDESEPEVETKKILTFLAPKTCCFVLVMEHPMSFNINGSTCVKVLSGTVQILGYNLDHTKDFVPVYSSPKLCSLRADTKEAEVKGADYFKRVKNSLSVIASKKVVSAVLNTCKDSSVIVILKKNHMAAAVQFAHFYIPCALPIHKPNHPAYDMMANLGFTISSDDNSTISLTPAHDAAADVIKRAVCSFVAEGGKAPRILVYGQKNLGKSTSLRYFINRVLSMSVEKVYYLDLDPGQSEFTLPGCISVSEITKPLLGPSYSHLKMPEKCFFSGALTLDDGDLYFKLLREIMNYCESYLSDEILFINTVGWIKGLGLEALNEVKTFLQPTIEVELFRVSDEVVSHNISSYMIEETAFPRKLRIPSFVQPPSNIILPATRRSISILSYFGKLQPYWEPIKSLSTFTTFCVCANDLAIHIVNADGLDLQKLNIINCSVVALCVVDESEIIDCVDNLLPKRLVPETNHGHCLGFGFVRAIDITKKLLYIVTPLPRIMLRSVNALIKGKVQIPEEVIKKQTSLRHESTVPYLQYCQKGGIGPKVPRRTFRIKDN